jgi:hypothetical protein
LVFVVIGSAVGAGVHRKRVLYSALSLAEEREGDARSG